MFQDSEFQSSGLDSIEWPSQGMTVGLEQVSFRLWALPLICLRKGWALPSAKVSPGLCCPQALQMALTEQLQ